MCLLLVYTAAADIPPLEADDRGELLTADDGSERVHYEAAFSALLRNAASWTPGPGNTAVRVQPDFAAMLSDPDAFRGEVCLISGSIDAIEILHPPYTGVEAWFVRTADHTPVLVYVDLRNRERPSGVKRNAHVEIYARFYKRHEAIARDETMHAYAAFVGAFPLISESRTSTTASPATFLLVAVVILGTVFFILWIFTRRQNARDPRTRRYSASASGYDTSRDDFVDTGPTAAELPSDPAEALAVLAKQAPLEDTDAS
ncbi:MAG: hypothetical protein ACR2GY_09840 [Phycisphaerales bacterium]